MSFPGVLRIGLNPAFAEGSWIGDLVRDGVLHPECARVFRLKKDAGDAGLPLKLHRHQVEAVHAARSEQAGSVGDVLLRRTRLGLLAARELCAPGGQGPALVAAAMAPELGWDGARTAAEVEAFAAEAAREGIVPA